jgi:hypothetical protein
MVAMSETTYLYKRVAIRLPTWEMLYVREFYGQVPVCYGCPARFACRERCSALTAQRKVFKRTTHP